MVHLIQTGSPGSPSLMNANAMCNSNLPVADTQEGHATGLEFTSTPMMSTVSPTGSPDQATTTPTPESQFGRCPIENEPKLACVPDVMPDRSKVILCCSERAQQQVVVTDQSTGLGVGQEVYERQNSQLSKQDAGIEHTGFCVKTHAPSGKLVEGKNTCCGREDSYHIFVGDLAPDLEDDVLLTTFAALGNVTECKIVKDMHTQKPKGYGFVAFASKQEAERAIRLMNGRTIGSRVIRTNWAVRRDPADQAKDHRPLNYLEVFNASSPTNTTIYVGGIVSGLTETLLVMSFKEFGEIKEVRIFKDKGFSFIRFDTHAAAAKAIVNMHGRPVGGQPCKCSWGKEPAYTNKSSHGQYKGRALFSSPADMPKSYMHTADGQLGYKNNGSAASAIVSPLALVTSRDDSGYSSYTMDEVKPINYQLNQLNQLNSSLVKTGGKTETSCMSTQVFNASSWVAGSFIGYQNSLDPDLPAMGINSMSTVHSNPISILPEARYSPPSYLTNKPSTTVMLPQGMPMTSQLNQVNSSVIPILTHTACGLAACGQLTNCGEPRREAKCLPANSAYFELNSTVPTQPLAMSPPTFSMFPASPGIVMPNYSPIPLTASINSIPIEFFTSITNHVPLTSDCSVQSRLPLANIVPCPTALVREPSLLSVAYSSCGCVLPTEMQPPLPMPNCDGIALLC